MTPDQIRLVRTSWQSVIPMQEKAAELFYGKLFEMEPAIRPLFKGDMREQGRKLMQMLDTIVQQLDNLNNLLPQVEDLAQRHVEYGVKNSDYATVGSALLWTLEAGLGSAFTPDVKEAWNTAYTALSDAMTRDAEEPVWPEDIPPPHQP